jgi:hypothetical protein
MKGARRKMLLLLLNLLQQGRLSKAVIVGAVLLFLAGVSLLVYFYRKYQRIEKESEEDFTSRSSLFVGPPSEKAETVSGTTQVSESPAAETTPAPSGGTKVFGSLLNLQPPAAKPESPRVETPTPSEPIEPVKHPAPAEASTEERSTQVLASPVAPTQNKEAEHEPVSFDEEIWAGLEVQEQAGEQGGETKPSQAGTEQLPAARVDERSHREPFEPPRIERVTHREPYESPRIEPITPRDQAAVTQSLHSAPSSQTPAASNEPKERIARDTIIFGTKVPESKPEPSAAEPVIAASGRMAEPSLAGARSYKTPAGRTPAGSVLGLPAETSHGPLILGEPARQSADAGIEALTNYGKDMSPKAGYGGTIALLIVIALFGGAVLVYLFVPSVHARVNAFVGSVRGVDTQASTKPKAQIIPSYRPEVNKNIVTARGAIDNISDEPLENLEVEVSLERGGDAPAEVRRVAVTPSPLAPNGRGNFEFQYDGKRDTGFVGYKITKLYSNGNEIKFRTPNQK